MYHTARSLPSKQVHGILINYARVAKLVDARDLKSLDRKVMRVRLPPRAPELNFMANNHIQKFPRGVEVVGSAIIEDGEGKILLVKSPKWNYLWTMPGGHIEPGEGIEEALLREAEEEVGLKLKSMGIISFGELIGPRNFHRHAHFIYFDILCKTKNKKVKLDNKELTEYVWANPKQALKMGLAESYDKTIKEYLKFNKLL